MSLIVHIYLKKGNLEPRVRGTITNDDGSAVDLTGAAITFYMEHELGTIKINNGAASLVGPGINGTVEYLWVGTDTNTKGDYRAWFNGTLANGKPLSSPSRDYIAVHIG